MKSLLISKYSVLFGAVVAIHATAYAEPYGPFNLDGGKIACNNDNGPEIKKPQIYKAPTDRFFIEKSIKINKVSGWGKKSECSIIGVKKEPITVKTDAGEFQVEVITEFTGFAHADCGSGVVNNSGGKTASIECTVSAEMQKYTNK